MAHLDQPGRFTSEENAPLLRLLELLLVLGRLGDQVDEEQRCAHQAHSGATSAMLHAIDLLPPSLSLHMSDGVGHTKTMDRWRRITVGLYHGYSRGEAHEEDDYDCIRKRLRMLTTMVKMTTILVSTPRQVLYRGHGRLNGLLTDGL
jgi:hypothetical protein